nr:Hsp20/alpha crystallin family protein [uncultured Desulfobacter sp.]
MLTRRFFDTPVWDFDVTKPFAEIERLRRRMDRLFDEWMPSTWNAGRTMGVFPLINLTEDQESYILRAEIPGVKAENLDIQVTAKSVSISGERHLPQKKENVSYHRRERECGRFSRAVALSGEIAPDSVNAKLKHGVLTLRLPKTEGSKAKQISVMLSQS